MAGPLTLLVLRCADVEAAARLYAALGLTPRPERHGDGPAHYSCRLGDTVLELYPAGTRAPSGVRLGLVVDDLERAVASVPAAGGRVTRRGPRAALIEDLDGNQILLEAKA